MFDTQEKLVEYFKNHGIQGEWINPDKNGFSRTFQFEVLGQVCKVEWYWNYSELQIGNARFWFDRISDNNSYPCGGMWLEFIYKGENGLHLKIGG